MITANITPAPVGQQAPRAAASLTWRALRDARRPLPLTTGTACSELNERQQH
jgi:hypothetical protein